MEGQVYLCYPGGSSYTRLYLAQMDDSRNPHNLQHTIVVIGSGEVVVLIGAPRVGAAAPTTENYTKTGKILLD